MKSLPLEIIAMSAQEKYAVLMKQVNLGYLYVVDLIKDPNAHVDFSVTIYDTKYGFNQYSIMTQYFRWIGNIFTKFDWGTSTALYPGYSAMEIIGARIWTSMKPNIISIFISIPVGIGLGIWAALKKNTMTDHIISTLIMVFISVPSFVLISYLILIFGFNLHVLPKSWPGANDPIGQQVLGYVIPVAALSFGSIAGFARYTRAELTEVMSSEFLLLARTKGLTKTQTVLRHALRNSMVPIVPMIIGEFIGILGGSMILENLYNIPGIGFLYVSAVSKKDYNVVMVDMAVYTMIGLFATLLVDLSYGLVDPRIRMGARK